MRPPATLSIAIALGMAASAAGGRALAAQRLIGTVRDSASGLPIPRAVVTLLDSAAVGVAQTLTNERGEFRVMMLRHAARRVRVVRLGFRPVVVATPAPRDGIIKVDVTMTPIPMALNPVQVTASQNCPVRRDNARALSLLEHARAGLLATIVARSEKPARMKRLRANRTFDGTSTRVLHQQVRIDSGPTLGAFGAPRTAADFVRGGFTGDSLGLQAYFGPDAEVLVDDAFAKLYCFHIEDRDRARANQVGLGFRPATRRVGLVDIEGAIWIDTVARALVDIEFRYVGLDLRTEPFRPGGHVFFREMPNGAVVLDRWSLRTVGVKDDPGDRAAYSARFVSGTGSAEAVDPRLYGLEGWGELARAVWADGYQWRGSLGTLRLRVIDRGGAPAAGTLVRLTDTDYAGVADSTGLVEIPDLLPGPYGAEIADAELRQIGLVIPTPLQFTAVRDSVIHATLETRSPSDYVAERCRGGPGRSAAKGSKLASAAAMLIARVTTHDGQPVARARWNLRRLTGASGSRSTSAIRDADVGSDGVFHTCALQRLETVELAVRSEGYHDARLVVELTKPVTILSVRLQPRRR